MLRARAEAALRSSAAFLSETTSSLAASINPNHYSIEDDKLSSMHIFGEERKKDLVIGMAKSLLEEQLAIFAASLRDYAKAEDVDVVIFIDAPSSNRMKEIAKKYAVKLEIFDQKAMPHPTYHPSTYRWPMIHSYLSSHQDQYRRVLTADVRDTYFQANPFPLIFHNKEREEKSESNEEELEEEEEEAFWVFEDDPNKMISDCYWNSGWIHACFGMEVLQSLADRNIYCSGISAGTTKAMLGYTNLMTEKINQEDFHTCERNGVDQGMHNVFIHQGQIQHLHRMDQFTGVVANLQSFVGKMRESDYHVTNIEGEEYAVIHQYDRHPELAKVYLQRYVYWDRSEGGAVCQQYEIIRGGDLLAGTCDINPAGGIDADMCCKVCDREKGCQGFAHVGGTCFLKSCNGPRQQANGDNRVTMGLKKKSEVVAVQ